MKVVIAALLPLFLAGCRASQGDAHAVHDTSAAAVARTTPDTTPALAAANADIDMFTAAQLSSAAGMIARGSSTASVLARRPDRYYVEARRVTTGVPEVHDDFSDVTFVQSGRATLLTGAVRGSHLESRGEHRGGTIGGGVRRAIATGDFFVIPHGIAHQYEVAAGDSIRYLTVKVRKPD